MQRLRKFFSTPSGFALGLVLGLSTAALATAATYQYKDNLGALFNVLIWPCGGNYCTGMVQEDSTGNEKGVVGNPQYTALSDGTNGPAAVKPSSTAASATDKSLVVQSSPNDGNIGAPGASVCSTDTGSCSLNSLLQRIAARISTLISNIGSPFQAGGSIGNSSFGAATSPIATNPTSTLTLPATTTAYSAGQLIANNATAASVTVPSFAIANGGGGAIISRLRLSTNDVTSTAWGGHTIQVDLWSAAPTWTNGDRGAWSPATGTANHLGAFTCVMSAEYGDGAYAECAPAVGNVAVPKLASGAAIFWSLESVDGSGVTGTSKVFTLAAELLN